MEKGTYAFLFKASYYADRKTLSLAVECEVAYTFTSSSRFTKEQKKEQVIERLLEHGSDALPNAKWKWGKREVEKLLFEMIFKPVTEGLEQVGAKVCERKTKFDEERKELEQFFSVLGRNDDNEYKNAREKESKLIYGRHEGVAFDHFGALPFSFPTNSVDVAPIIFTGTERKLFCDRILEKKDDERTLVVQIEKITIGMVKWDLHVNCRIST